MRSARLAQTQLGRIPATVSFAKPKKKLRPGTLTRHADWDMPQSGCLKTLLGPGLIHWLTA